MIRGRTFLFVANVDWFFISHRLPIAMEVRQRGGRVVIAAGDTGRLSELVDMGFSVIPIPIERGGLGVLQEMKTAHSIRRVISEVEPDLIHTITIKPNLYSSLARRWCQRDIPTVLAISGYGWALQDERHTLGRRLIRAAYRLALRRENRWVIFQNRQALHEFVQDRVAKANRSVIIPGSGVPLDLYVPSTDSPSGKIGVLFASRLLRDKGVWEFLRAATLFDDDSVKWMIAGKFDRDNPAAVDPKEFLRTCAESSVEYLGHCDDMPALLQSADIFVLPSYHEGFPRVLQEAAACGLPLVATDIPGCGDAVIDGVNGILVKVGSSSDISFAVQQLVNNPRLRSNMGRESRRLAMSTFSQDLIVDQTIHLYSRMLGLSE